jgi:hypothetical protein
VIVTTLMQILKNGDITFVPELPSEYQIAMTKFDLEPGVKVFIEFEQIRMPLSMILRIALLIITVSDSFLTRPLGKARHSTY